ncbi:TRAP transporter small permease [Pseudaestuariivita sp.]|uniref:TRAP transporter small permease n=1 Tax=Pseudaestuariivita sp. TaxID=2211669 RepID=UPI0040580BB9
MAERPSFTDRIEETLIAALLGLMTALTFANVVARYVFNANILWALELTVFMFAWLVLLGASYAVKKSAHLGVDAVVNLCAPPVRRILGLIAVSCCILFCVFLLKGAYDYWAVFADLPPTSGRWFPTGLEDRFRSQSFYETLDIPMIAPLRFLEDLINYGDSYEKIPRVVPYVVLPLSMALLLFRFSQAAVAMWKGDITLLVASHEVEEELDELRKSHAAEEAK